MTYQVRCDVSVYLPAHFPFFVLLIGVAKHNDDINNNKKTEQNRKNQNS